MNSLILFYFFPLPAPSHKQTVHIVRTYIHVQVALYTYHAMHVPRTTADGLCTWTSIVSAYTGISASRLSGYTIYNAIFIIWRNCGGEGAQNPFGGHGTPVPPFDDRPERSTRGPGCWKRRDEGWGRVDHCTYRYFTIVDSFNDFIVFSDDSGLGWMVSSICGLAVAVETPSCVHRVGTVSTCPRALGTHSEMETLAGKYFPGSLQLTFALVKAKN